ncbi:MAG: antibiotic biosynthesis monooxygenase family protein [Thermodesulfobacteriota bacterium]
MYVRMTFFKLKTGKMGELRELYNKEVVSTHKGHKGIRFVHLLESLDNQDEGISITAWDTKADVEAYEKSGEYEKLVTKFKNMYAGEPLLKSYEVTSSSDPIILRLF